MKFRFVIGSFLLFVFSGCMNVQSPQSSQSLPQASPSISKQNTAFSQAYPAGVLHFAGVVETSSGPMAAAFSILPDGKIIQTIKPDLLPASLKKYADMINPAWSVQGGKIVFAALSDQEFWVICTMDGDGKNLKIIYTAEPLNLILSPIWSASGREIFFLSSRIEASGSKKVVLSKMSDDGKDLSEIAVLPFPGAPQTLRLSSDGKHAAGVYFVEHPEGAAGKQQQAYEFALHIFSPLNGAEEKKVSGSDAAWSPDSKKIAIIQERSPFIQIMDISTGATVSIPTGARFPKRLAWSPDGSRLSYISEREKEQEEQFLLQVLTLENAAKYDVPVKLQNWGSGLFWTL